ncbi:MAG: ATP-binding protein [Bacteroidales bacterium]|nr:ATP-binding protein [Bacteroidales bacterium]
MLKRKIYNDLVSWKNTPSHKPLIVRGARQIGKTYVIDLFCKENYENYVNVNFFERPDFATIFEGELTAESIFKRITLFFPKNDFSKGKSVVFLDEIQQCPNARTALKFLNQNPYFDVVCSGSMLGIHYNDVKSYPVGQVDYLDMYSLSFEEFLWANGYSQENILDLKEEYYLAPKPLPEGLHNRFMELFKEFIIVGGMPNVVWQFVNNHDFRQVRILQKAILDDYLDDIAKYADKKEKTKARSCFLSIPRHLSHDYKKFRYSLVEARGTSSKFGGSLMWLYDAGYINFCHNLELIASPLRAYSREDVFKVYMKDTGLLVAMLDEDTPQKIISGDLSLYKGALFENIIADILAKNGRDLYYFEYKSQLELDFIIKLNGKVTAVEVKSSLNVKSKSMKSALENHNVEQGVLLSTRNVEIASENVLRLPLYMAMFL